MKRSRFKVNPHKINPKDFTQEVIAQMNSEQGGRCLKCGVFTHLDPHHKKPRSAISAMDLKIFGAGGGRDNCIGLCRVCHEAVHRHDEGTEPYRTKFNQEVGESASDL